MKKMPTDPRSCGFQYQPIIWEKSQFVIQLSSNIRAIDKEHASEYELITSIKNKLLPEAGDEMMAESAFGKGSNTYHALDEKLL